MALNPTPTQADFDRAHRLGGILAEAGIVGLTFTMEGSTVVFRCADMAQARAALDAVTRRGFGIRAKAQKRYGEPSLVVRR